MGKKKTEKVPAVSEASWTLDTKEYWRSFEYLALEVLYIKLKTREGTHKILDKDVTKSTRDHGRDGFIQFSIRNDSREYTVEAKLRSSDKISLKDIATSILYYLIGTSDRHLIVTNVIFTGETLAVINELQAQMGRPLETVDGYELRRLLNKGLTYKEEHAPELIKLLMAQPLPPKETIPQPKAVLYRILEKHYCVASRTALKEAVAQQIMAGEKLFLIKGEQGTGKSHLIREIIKWAEGKNYKVCRIDMSKLYSPRIFVLNILQIVLGLDLNALLDCLDASDKEEMAADLLALEGGVMDEYGRAVRYLLTQADNQEESTRYLLRCLLSELIQRCSGGRDGLLVVEGLANSQREMVQYLLYVLDVLVGEQSRFSAIFEMPVFRSQAEIGGLSLEDWNGFARELQSTPVNGQRPQIISLENYTELESRTVLEQALELQPLTLELQSQIIARVGTNPGNLFPAIELINRQRQYTRFDIENLPLSGDISPGVMYLQTLLEAEKTAGYLHLSFSLLCDLEGSISLPLNICLEQEFGVVPGTLRKTGLFCESETEVWVQNGSTLDAMKRLLNLDMGTRQTARKWLLTHLDKTGWTEARKSGRKLWLKLLLRQKVSDAAIEKARKALKKADAQEEMDLLLLEAYRCRRHENNYSQALDYLLRYLGQQKFNDKFNVVKYGELLNDADRLATELDISDVPVSHPQKIKLNTMHYWQCKTKYDYEGCARFTGKILEIEAEPLEAAERQKLERDFIKARIFAALNCKERGDRLGCVRGFRKALRRYPQDKELRISCYMNLAAFFYHTAPGTAKKFLDSAISLAKDLDGKMRNHWWAHNDGILCDILAGQRDLSAVVKAREAADRRYSLSNLARCFNFEGFLRFERGERLAAINCFTKAAEVGVAEGGNKPSFLFLTNVISVKLALGGDEDVNDELDRAFEWLSRHFEPIAERICRNRARATDHLFAAVVSWVVSARAAKRQDLEDGFRKRWEGLPNHLPYAVFGQANLHPDFLQGDAIIVLF